MEGNANAASCPPCQPRPTNGPNTQTLLQFRVIERVGPPDPLNFNATLAAL